MSSTRKALKGKPEPNEGAYAFYPQTRQVEHISFDPVIARRASNPKEEFHRDQLRETDADGNYIYFEDDPFGMVEEERQHTDAARQKLPDRIQTRKAKEQAYYQEKKAASTAKDQKIKSIAAKLEAPNKVLAAYGY